MRGKGIAYFCRTVCRVFAGIVLKGVVKDMGLCLAVGICYRNARAEAAQRCKDQYGADRHGARPVDDVFLKLSEVENAKPGIPPAGLYQQRHSRPQAEEQQQRSKKAKSKGQRHFPSLLP